VARTEGLQPWRRVFHATNGVLLVSVLVVVDPPWSWTVAALGALTVALFLADWLRFQVPSLNRLFFRLLRPFASPREARGVASSTWYMAGCLLALALFPREVAIPAILVLALADPVASYMGRRWGRRPFGTGTVEGSVVFATVAFLVLTPFVGWAVGAMVAVATAGAERIPWPLDDNLTIPLVAGALAWSLLPWWG
jgi:dolichol kinase